MQVEYPAATYIAAHYKRRALTEQRASFIDSSANPPPCCPTRLRPELVPAICHKAVYELARLGKLSKITMQF